VAAAFPRCRSFAPLVLSCRERSKAVAVAPLLADTHALVWHLTEPKRLGRAARRALADADSGRRLCYVPVIALVEIWLLSQKGRLRIGPAQVLDVLSDHPGYSVLTLDVEQALEFGSLVGVRDPMDRLVIAAARVTRSRVVSVDPALDGHGVERIWD
jgi:PIN domain nuclease of toxin-antitoxin system